MAGAFVYFQFFRLQPTNSGKIEAIIGCKCPHYDYGRANIRIERAAKNASLTEKTVQLI